MASSTLGPMTTVEEMMKEMTPPSKFSQHFGGLAAGRAPDWFMGAATPPTMNVLATDARLVEMIAMRMRWTANYYPEPFKDFLAAHKRGEDVHVFAIVGGRPLTFTDPWSLFPSDGFITQLRLLEGS